MARLRSARAAPEAGGDASMAEARFWPVTREIRYENLLSAWLQLSRRRRQRYFRYSWTQWLQETLNVWPLAQIAQPAPKTIASWKARTSRRAPCRAVPGTPTNQCANVRGPPKGGGKSRANRFAHRCTRRRRQAARRQEIAQKSVHKKTHNRRPEPGQRTPHQTTAPGAGSKEDGQDRRHTH